MNKSLKTLIIVLISVLVLSFVIVGIGIFIFFKFMNNYKSIDYYEFENDKVIAITKVVGKRNISSMSVKKDKNITTKIYKYTNVKNTKSDIDNYIQELKKDNYINTMDIDLSRDNGNVELATYSVDKNKVIIIDISYNINSYTITIKKGNGSIQSFE